MARGQQLATHHSAGVRHKAPHVHSETVAPYLQDAAVHRRLHPEAAYSAMLSTSTFEIPKEG